MYIQVKILVFQKENATIYVELKNFFSFVRQWNEHSGLCVWAKESLLLGVLIIFDTFLTNLLDFSVKQMFWLKKTWNPPHWNPTFPLNHMETI